MGLDHLLKPVLLDVLAQHLLKVSKKSSSTRSAGGARARQHCACTPRALRVHCACTARALRVHCLCTGDCTGGCTRYTWLYSVSAQTKITAVISPVRFHLGRSIRWPPTSMTRNLALPYWKSSVSMVRVGSRTLRMSSVDLRVQRGNFDGRRWALARPPGGISASAHTHAQ